MMMGYWLFDGLRLTQPALMPAGAGGSNAGHGLGRWQQALLAAGLTGLQRSCGSLTLLAPTDAAFEALLGEQSLSWDLLCADTARLRALLLGHVLHASALQAGHLHGLGDAVIEVRTGAQTTWLIDANQRRAQLLSSEQQWPGGPLLHRIDRVLLPPQRDLMQQLRAQPELSEFTRLLEASGLASLLRGSGPFTLFAPGNAELADLAWLAARLGLRQRALMPGQPPGPLAQVLGQHLLPGRWLSGDLPWGDALRTVAGSALPLAALGLVGAGDSAQALLPGSDLLASNGVIHRIARVLLPPESISAAD